MTNININCGEVNCYIGQTKRALKTRLKTHIINYKALNHNKIRDRERNDSYSVYKFKNGWNNSPLFIVILIL